jgi:hypothetical protein
VCNFPIENGEINDDTKYCEGSLKDLEESLESGRCKIVPDNYPDLKGMLERASESGRCMIVLKSAI